MIKKKTYNNNTLWFLIFVLISIDYYTFIHLYTTPQFSPVLFWNQQVTTYLCYTYCYTYSLNTYIKVRGDRYYYSIVLF